VKSRSGPPTWPLLALAAAGFLLSGSLWFGTGGAEGQLCPAGSGCQVAQASRYATLLGAPLPVYGMAYYGTLLVLAGWGSDPARRWQLALPVAAAGASFRQEVCRYDGSQGGCRGGGGDRLSGQLTRP
jgi:uncharacterized membrane protein